MSEPIGPAAAAHGPQETSETAREALVPPHGKGFAAPPVAPSPKQSEPARDTEWVYRENSPGGLHLYRQGVFVLADQPLIGPVSRVLRWLRIWDRRRSPYVIAATPDAETEETP